MEKFWAVILIFAIVAAGGLLYVNQVYAPQKEAQVAMANAANNTLTAVKTEMDNSETRTFVTGADVIDEVEDYCSRTGNTVTITVRTNNGVLDYMDDSSGIAAHVNGPAKQFVRTPNYDNGVLMSIEFKEF